VYGICCREPHETTSDGRIPPCCAALQHAALQRAALQPIAPQLDHMIPIEKDQGRRETLGDVLYRADSVPYIDPGHVDVRCRPSSLSSADLRSYTPTRMCTARAWTGPDDGTTVMEILYNSYWNNHPCPLPFFPRPPRRERSHFGCSSPDPFRQGASNRMGMAGSITLACSELRRATFYDTKP
jgi:hypothetical protein